MHQHVDCLWSLTANYCCEFGHVRTYGARPSSQPLVRFGLPPYLTPLFSTAVVVSKLMLRQPTWYSIDDRQEKHTFLVACLNNITLGLHDIGIFEDLFLWGGSVLG